MITHDTYRHIEGVFDAQTLEPVAVKGHEEPVRVYLVTQEKPRLLRSVKRGVEGVRTSMIRRDAELKQLEDTLYTVMQDREPQVVTVVGDAGLGKTRLRKAFERLLDIVPDTVYLFKGQANQGEQGVPYGLLRDLFARRFGVQDSDSAQLVREKVEHGMAAALGRSEETQVRAHILGQLLGFDFRDSPFVRGAHEDAKQLRDRALVYLGDYFKVLTEQNAALILLEDIHWADDQSLDVLSQLAVTWPNLPVCRVRTARPKLLECRPHWGEGQDFHARITLRPLSKRENRRLVEEILQKVEEIPPALSDLIVSSAEGNPYYAEELVKMLIEDRIILSEDPVWQVDAARLEETRVPPTLTEVLQARIDSLPPQERKLLQCASVIGRVFWDQALAILSQGADLALPETLGALRGREMIFRREQSSLEETEEFIFKHALLRDVAYETVLKRDRQLYHTRAAQWLEDVAERTSLRNSSPSITSVRGKKRAHRSGLSGPERRRLCALPMTMP